MSALQKYRKSLHSVNGYRAPSFVLQERVDELKNLQLFEDDVWVVGAPKTGTHWMQQILKLLQNGGKQDDVKLPLSVPWLEGTMGVNMKVSAFLTDVKPEDMPRPRTFKSHFPYNALPCGSPDTSPGKYVYVARNPKDRIVSMYVMMKVYYPELSFDDLFEEEMTNCLYGDYFDHLLSFWRHKDDQNILFVKYEDMKNDLGSAIQRIASFIDADVTQDAISWITEMTTFKNMKANSTANYSWDKAFDKEGEPTFIRKGIIGDWKNYLSQEQSARIDAICAEKLKPEGLEFEYE